MGEPLAKQIGCVAGLSDNRPMLGLIIANVRRRRARTALTAAGIAVGVAAIVALLGLSAGLNNTAGQLVHLGKADLGLFQADAGDPTSSVLPLSLLARVRAQPEVLEATPLQLVIGAVKGSPSAIVFGSTYGLCLVAGLVEVQRIANDRALASLTAVFYALTYLGFAAPYGLAVGAHFAAYSVLLGIGAILALATAVSVTRASRRTLAPRI